MSLPIIISLIIGLLFIQFVWIATDRRNFMRIIAETHKGSHSRTFLLIFFVLVLEVFTGLLLPLPTFGYDIYITLAGLFIYELGIALAVWAKVTMKESWGYPGQHNIKSQKKLVTTGPFTFTRNPIYLGLLLITFGFGITFRSYLAFLFIPLYLYFLNLIKIEETLLEKYFGDEYTAYKKKVRRFI